MSAVRRRNESPAALSSDDLYAAESHPPVSLKRRIGVFLVTLFVLVGTGTIAYLMLIRLPAQYRQQAERMIAPTIRAAQVDDAVYLGSYEQDNDPSNGTEPIEWVVLERQDDRCLLMSRLALDCIRFNEAEALVTWDESTILTWLNNTFYYAAFNGAERAMLIPSEQLTDTNPYFDTYPGTVTTEKIFLANIAQAAKYLPEEEDRQCLATPYAVGQGAVVDPESGFCLWWLRSPGFDESAATRVLLDGRINYCGYRVQSKRQGVRPWMWVTFEPNES